MRPPPDEENPLSHNEVERRCVAIDAANILHYNIPKTRGMKQTEGMNPDRLLNVIVHLEEKGWHIMAGMKSQTYEWAYNMGVAHGRMNDRQKLLLQSMVENQRISLIDKIEDDSWIIRAAIEHNGWLITNDKYRDWIKKHPDIAHEILDRRRGVEWVGDMPVINIPPYIGRTIIGTISDPEKKEILANWMCQDGSTIPVLLPLDDNIGREHFISSHGLNDLSISRISRKHLQIMLVEGDYIFFDLGSLNGTLVDGIRLKKGIGYSVDSGQEVELILGNQHNKLIIYPQLQDDVADDAEYTVVELKQKLRDLGLKVSGNKSELIARLEDSTVEADQGEIEEEQDDVATDESVSIIEEVESDESAEEGTNLSLEAAEEKIVESINNCSKDENGWAFLASIGEYLKKLNPPFDSKSFGVGDGRISTLIKALPRFEYRLVGIVAYVREVSEEE